MIMHRFKKTIAAVLLFTNTWSIVVAAIVPTNNALSQANLSSQNGSSYAWNDRNPNAQIPSNLSLSTNQFGITSPLNAGIDYNDLTGGYFTGQFLKAINDEIGFNILGEYGAKQYRINGTLGFLLNATTFFKISAEQLAQKLPFSFSTGSVEQQVSQHALGARFQHDFAFTNVSLGTYVSKAPNKMLSPVYFVSNASNCNGVAAGFTCVNERNIAGASTSGADVGMGFDLNSKTYLESKFFYDTVRYNTIFTSGSQYNTSGYGGGIYAQHLLASNFKFAAGAEIRKIYDTYNVALSWMPRWSNAVGTEFSLSLQHVASHNQTPDANTAGLKINFFADRVDYNAPIYGLNNAPVVTNIASWISQPAVKMNRVLAISENYVHVADMKIDSVSPGFGPLTGGNTVTISGRNFPSGISVRFGSALATISSMTVNSITIIVPPGAHLGGVTIYLTTPEGKTIAYESGYLYTNGIAPIISSVTPLLGPSSGGTQVNIVGSNFRVGETRVRMGDIEIDESSVTINSTTSLTYATPPHASGSVLVSVDTDGGPSQPYPNGFTFIGAPTANGINPTSGSPSGGDSVTITGTNFVINDTSVTVDGIAIPASSVTVHSPTSLSFSTPAHVAGNVGVVITTPGGTVAVPGGFLYSNNAPTASSLSLAFSPSSGGVSVTVSGTNFEVGTTSVTIGGIVVPAAVSSSNLLTFITPAHAVGYVDIYVTTLVGSSGLVPGGLMYEDPPTATSLNPTSGSEAGGTLITISGSNFIVGDTSVTIDGIAVPAGAVTVNSASSLTFSSPAHLAGNVEVTVSTTAGTSSPIIGGFTYQSSPTATSLSPSFGSTAGGTAVTIAGTNFVAGGTSVLIGGTLIPEGDVTVNSPISLTFTTPSHAAGTVTVSVTTAGGVSNIIPGGFTYTAAPTVTSLSPAFGSIAGGTSVSIIGNHFVAGDSSVTIDGVVIPASSVIVSSATSLTFSTPVHAAGNVDVSVATSGGTSGTIPGGFTYEDVPSASSLNPAFGSSAGGTSVTLAGTNFIAGDTAVTIGGIVIPASSVTVNSSTSLTFSTPVHAAGNVAVTVSTSGGTSSAVAGGFTYEDVSTAASLSPAFGSSAGGTLVTLIGTNFVDGDTSVTIGGIVIPVSSVTVNSSTSLTFSTPAHAAGNVAVTVNTSVGTSNAVAGGFTYAAMPTASSLSPAFGPESGGTLVTITGTNFIPGATSVTIGGTTIAAGSVTVNSDTSLTFSTPADAAGTVAVSVATSGGVSNNVSGGFTYVSAPTADSLSPAFGAAAGGTLVTIDGTNFVPGDTSVTIGGTVISASSVTVHSSTSLTFSTPAHAEGVVAVVVSTSGGINVAVPGGFTYEAIPVATSLSPAFGPSTGGTTVSIVGSNFVTGDTSVTMGGTVIPPSSVTVNSASLLTFNTPAHAAGTVAVSVTTSGGTSNNITGGYTYEDKPTAISLSPAFGPVTGGTFVTIEGENFVPGDTSVNVDGAAISSSAVMVNSATSLTFITPAHAAGNVTVNVTTSGGASADVAGGFTYDVAPTATSLSPAFGSIVGGTVVTITGADFVADDTSVTIGGTVIPAGSVTVNSSSSLTFISPAHAAGLVSVSVATSGGTSSTIPGGFTYEAPPTALSLSPSFGSSIGGTSVTLEGTNFIAGDTAVTIGGIDIPASSVTVNSSTSLTFNTPAHAAGAVEVTVTTSGGTSDPVAGGFIYEDVATAASLSPAFGTAAGGTSVSITGAHFVTGDTSVTIGGVLIPASLVTVNSSTSLTFNTPPHGAGIVAVTVTTSAGTSNAIPGGFTYEDISTTTSISPAFGSSAGGTVVTLSGTNFVMGDTSVTIGGIVIPAGLVTVNSATSLSFATPPHAAGTVSVSVTTSAGTSNAVSGGFTYEDAPTAASLSPAFGSSAGGTLVTVTGTNFVSGDTSVSIGGNLVSAGSVTVNSANSLTFSTPAHAAGNAAVTIMTSAGSSTIPGGFTYVDAPTATSLSPAFGPTAGGTSVTITGTNFVSGDTSVSIGGTVIAAGSVTVNSATSLTFSTPAHVAGAVAVAVTTPGGSSSLIPGGFTYDDNSATVTSLSPAFGSAAGGTSITIIGTNFRVGTTSVTIGGMVVPASSVTVNSPISLTFNAPPHTAGNVGVYVTTPTGDSGLIPGGFTYEDVPTTTSLSPTAGPMTGGTLVTVVGTGFVAGDTTVTVGSTTIPANLVTVNSATSLTFSTLAHAAGTVAVTVATSEGVSNAVPGGFTYSNNAATVSSLSPAMGPTVGGTSVTITGTNFSMGTTSVTVDGITVPAGSVTVNSATSLTFDTPVHAAGIVSIYVTTPTGDSGLVPGGFTYEAAPTATSLSPIAGPLVGGTSVTITGTNFVAGDTSVTIGGTVIPPGSVTVNSATSLTFITPVHAAGTVPVSVSTSGGISSNVSGGFTYEAAPTATLLSPAFGPITGGTLVAITGTDFVVGDTSVTIGGTVIPAGSVTVNSTTLLTFITPVHAAGTVAVSVATSGGTSGSVSGGFTYVTAPTATALAPAVGPIVGGTLVTITGTNFVAGDTSVTIDGTVIPAGLVTVNSTTLLTFITPAHAAGLVSVSVSTSGGTSSAISGGFTYQAAPTALPLNPAFGPIAGGTLVTITGTNFVAGDTSVTIGGTTIPASSVTVNSTTSLSFTTLAHTAGTVSVSVTTSGGSSGNIAGGFTYESPPIATLLSPAFGPIAGGTLVTITGTNFVAGDTSVTIGGMVIPAGSVIVSSATLLTFSTPAHAAGLVPVSVSTSGGISSNISGGFTYEAAPTATLLSPAFGPIAGGTLVTITGTNFVAGDTSVTIGGMVIPAGSVTVNSTTSLSFTTLAHTAGTVAVSVATSGGASSTVSGGFTYVAAPTATALAPVAGPIVGGTLVTITGTDFVAGDTSVMIGGTTIPAGSVTVNSTTLLTFITPAHAAGLVSVSVSTSGGTSSAIPGGFTYQAAPTALPLSPAFGPIAGGTLVTITGTNFVAGDTSVTIGGMVIPAGSVTVNSTTSLSFTTLAHTAGAVSVSVSTSGGSSGNIAGGFTYEALPTAALLSPAFGPIAGGTLVTITGTNFVAGDTSVTIGGMVIPAGSVMVNSATSLTFSTPAHAVGLVPVSVSTSGGISNNVSSGFTYEAPPTATLLSPAFGPTAGGTIVTITGTNFVAGDTSVTIGGTVIPAGSVAVNSTTSLSFTTLAHTAGTVSVSVSTSGGTTSNVAGGFTYEALPTATLLSPAFGPIAGGTLVTITGTNFVAGDTSVTIGGMVIPAGSVIVSSATSLTFSTPAHAAGMVPVSVSTSGGTTSNVAGGFTYEAPPTATLLSPAFGPIAGGTLVTITGTNFVAGDTSVTIGGTTVPTGSVIVSSANSLTFSTPAHAVGTVSVSVTTSGGSTGNISGGFTYEVAPTATALNPAAGPIAGGTLVTITGANFVFGDTTVTIGGVTIPSGSVTVNSATSLTFSTPAHAAGTVAVTVATSAGATGSISGGFTYRASPTAASINPTSGTTAGGTSVTITGTGFVAGDTSVTIGGNTVTSAAVTVNSATSLTFSTPARTAGTVSVSVTTSGGTSGNIPGGFTYLQPSLTSCSAPIPSILGIQLLTCVGVNLTLFQTTFLKASGSAACSTFPTQSIVPSVNVLGQVLITATNLPVGLSQGLIGCNVQVCSDSSCTLLGGVAGPAPVSLGL